jgi:hypothetical protein
MTRKPTKLARPRATILASAVAAVAMLALAGPASAHHGREDHHGRHHHHHGHKRSLDGVHGEAAGTIASYDQSTGKLVIDLADGNAISGQVTEYTWIESGRQGCHHGSSDERRQLHGWGDGGWGGHDHGSTADLVPGAVVEDAVLILADGHATFLKVELAPPASSPPTSSS